MVVIITESCKSKSKEHQGIFLQNGTQTIRTVWQRTVICQIIQAHNNHNKQVSPRCCDLVTNNVSSSEYGVTRYGN
jgi:hypothetical protein